MALPGTRDANAGSLSKFFSRKHIKGVRSLRLTLSGACPSFGLADGVGRKGQ